MKQLCLTVVFSDDAKAASAEKNLQDTMEELASLPGKTGIAGFKIDLCHIEENKKEETENV